MSEYTGIKWLWKNQKSKHRFTNKIFNLPRELLEVIRSLNTLEKNLVKSKIETYKINGFKTETPFELSEKNKESNLVYQMLKFLLKNLEKI